MLRNIKGNTVAEQMQSIDNLLEVATRRKEKQINISRCHAPLSGVVKSQGTTTLFLISCRGTLENFYLYNPTTFGKGSQLRLIVTHSKGGKFIDIPINPGFNDRNHSEEIVAGSVIQAEILYGKPEDELIEGLTIACTFKLSETEI